MPKRKKSPVKRVHRSPYERSLEYAHRRLEKALAEQMDCQVKLDALNKEIPYLQTVIRALTPPEDMPALNDGKWGHTPATTINPLNAKVPDHLKRFVQPVASSVVVPSNGGIVVDQSEPFIPDIVPGEELLP